MSDESKGAVRRYRAYGLLRGAAFLREHQDGEYVKSSDYDALAARLAAAEARVAEVEAKYEDLKTRHVRLKGEHEATAMDLRTVRGTWAEIESDRARLAEWHPVRRSLGLADDAGPGEVLNVIDRLRTGIETRDARLAAAEAWKDAVIDAAVTHESPCHMQDARKTLDAVIDAAVAEIESDRDRLAARLAAAEGERDTLRKVIDRIGGGALASLSNELLYPEGGDPTKEHLELANWVMAECLDVLMHPAPIELRQRMDRDRLAAAKAELQAEIDRINDAQAASLGAEICRLTEANAEQAREIERLQTAIRRGMLMGNPDNIRRELRAALAPAADASGEVTP